MAKIEKFKDIIDWNLCIGCGACYYYCDKNAVQLKNIPSIGIRPIIDESECLKCNKCISICPGYYIDSNINQSEESTGNDLIGPTVAIYTGYAADEEIRHRASSGGILTALSLYCLENEDAGSVIQTGMSEKEPYMSQTVISRKRNEVLKAAGSKYITSSPCNKLGIIEKEEKKSVFIGKPCDNAAVAALCCENNKLNDKIFLRLSFFCAGTPCSQATLNLINQWGISADSVNEVHYRGNGWPGHFRVLYNSGKQEKSMTYQESWAKLNKLRPFRCHLCADGLGEMSDITSGDNWYYYKKNKDKGHSIILVRTKRGLDILKKAELAGYIKLFPFTAEKVIEAQELIQRRKILHGRIFAFKLLNIPTVKYKGFLLKQAWNKNSISVKIKTILGTIRRIFKYKLSRKKPV